MDNKKFINYKDLDLTWAEKEFITAELGDKRLNKRLISITQAFAQRPQATIPQAMGEWTSSKATYRFFDNTKVTFEKILAPHKEATKKRVVDQNVILAIQDTSFIDYSSHPATKDLGFLSDKNHQGLIIHPTLVASPTGLPFGLIDLQILKRDTIGVKAQRRNKPIEQKESRKWLHSYRATTSFASDYPDKQVVNIADREGDIYDVFLETITQKKKFSHAPDILVRAAWNRRVEDEQKYIWQQLKSKNIAGTVDIEIPRNKQHPSRITTMEVRYDKITVRPPLNRASEKLKSLNFWAVYIHEQQAPEGIEPVSWMLLTTVEITDVNKALEIVRWYTCRWLIEIYFKVLKSGCKIEERQLEAAHRLKNCLAVDSIIAWRILFLTMIGREQPNLPSSVIFEESEWRALYTFVKKKPYTADSVPSLGQAIHEIAKLGGFLARNSDGNPGIICMWRGMWRLADISATWKIFNSKNDCPPPKLMGRRGVKNINKNKQM